MKANVKARAPKEPWVGAKALVSLESGNFWIVSKTGIVFNSKRHILEPSIYPTLKDVYEIVVRPKPCLWIYEGDTLELQF